MDGCLCGGHHSFNFCDAISLENLLMAWQEFKKARVQNPMFLNLK